MYYFSDEPHHEIDCIACDEKENKLDDVKYWLKQLLEQLYSTEKLNKNECEICLGELSSIVNLKIPSKEISIERKMTTTVPTLNSSNVLEQWVQWNNQYLNNLIG